MATTTLPLISQTLLKSVLPNDACAQAVKFRFIDGIEWPPSDLMLRGKYFEHKLIGACRGGQVPELPKLKSGAKSAAEKDLDELITWARVVMEELKIDIKGAEVQLEITDHNGNTGNLDMVANDIQEPGRKAIYDVKYTETKYDDRWNGWADFDNKHDEKIQASQYIMLYHNKTGKWVPYYFLVFGKSFWCRIIKVVVTGETMIYHTNRIDVARGKLRGWAKDNWPANPEFHKCQECPYNERCKFVANKPTIEIHEI